LVSVVAGTPPSSPTQDSRLETAAELTAGVAAKVLATGVYVSRREADDVMRESVNRMVALLGQRADDITLSGLDRERATATVRIGDSPARTARFYDDQGCVLLPRGQEDVSFERLKLRRRERSTEPWPTGDRTPDDEPPQEDVDAGKLELAVETAFARGAETAAFLVVRHGRILAERYGAGAAQHTPLESWSMGKSLTALLYARALHLAGEAFDPDVRADIPEWEVVEDDPRAAIRIGDLLQMSSGLRFTHPSVDPPQAWDHGHADHAFVYSGAIDTFAFVASRNLEHDPGSIGRYRNCDTLLIGYLMKRKVLAMGLEYLAFPQEHLFDLIGIRHLTLECDPYGNFLSSGFEVGTGRDWTRLGLLALQDGVWEGERLLPEGFLSFVSKPAPAWPSGEYGGQFWVNTTGRWKLPQSAFLMSGHGAQHVFVVPTHDLVITRMGHQRGGPAGAQALNQALGLLMEAIPSSK
jgi:CubicO group peptidase (beta-lactamase class C family)